MNKTEKKKECRFCVKGNNEVMCEWSSSQSGLFCTRKSGHPGQHVACGIYRHDMERWNQKRSELA